MENTQARASTPSATAQAVRRSQRIANRRASAAQAKKIPVKAKTHDDKASVPKARKRRAARQVPEASPPHKKIKPLPVLSGLWDLLPQELLDMILDKCTAQQLAVLETTCNYFRHTKMIEGLAEMRLKAIPRAKGLTPNPRAYEKYTSLLHFVLGQSAAAAQATAVAFGANHTSALLISPLDGNTGHHSLYTCGRGYYGQLGHGDYEPQPKPKLLCIGYQPCMDYPDMEEEITPAVVACGSEYTASITRRGQLLTWGLGSRGELGHELPSAGEVPYPMRTLLTSRPDIRIVSVACGSSHTLAISELGCVWSCGRNQDGQLGNGGFADGMQLRPVVGISKGQRVVSCAAGVSHSMALASDGSLFTWGCGKYGQLGHLPLQQMQLIAGNQTVVLATPQKIHMLEPALLQPWRRVTSIAAGAHHGCAVTVSGAILMFGRNHHGQLGTGDHNNRWCPTEVTYRHTGEPDDNFRAVQVVCGLQHSLALIAHRGRVLPYSTGTNVFGQLGHGNQKPLNTFKQIKKLASGNVVALQAGDHNSAAICEGGDVYLWGRNDNRQMGMFGDTSLFSPALLEGFKAVHPDKTLRKSKRTAPRMRPAVPVPPAAPKVPCNNQVAKMFGIKQQNKASTPLPAVSATKKL